MHAAFAIIAALTVVSGIAAMSLRNLVHCALCVAVTFAGLAALYLQLGAPFVGWAQVLVYVGAVAILIVFAILLTRSDAPAGPVGSPSWVAGVAVALLVFAVLAGAIWSGGSVRRSSEPPDKPEPTVKAIGNQLMTQYVLPLEATGLLLTAATIGAVILAMRDEKPGAHGKSAAETTTNP
jgi:NADH-quinone oxidoreductase subunit J